MRRAVLMIRQAISPRLAIRIRLNIACFNTREPALWLCGGAAKMSMMPAHRGGRPAAQLAALGVDILPAQPGLHRFVEQHGLADPRSGNILAEGPGTVLAKIEFRPLAVDAGDRMIVEFD